MAPKTAKELLYAPWSLNREAAIYYLGSLDGWINLPLGQIGDRLRSRGWGVHGSDDVHESISLMNARVLPTLEERFGRKAP